MTCRLPVIFVTALWAVAAVAAGPPSVESHFPPCARRGEATVINLSGARLDGLREVAFYGQGISVESIQPTGTGSCKVTVRVAQDAPLGPNPFRARGDDGYSVLKLLHVVALPVVALAENEATGSNPKALVSDCCITGVLAEGEVHRFSVNLRKGQRIVAEAVGMRAGNAFLDTHLELLSPSGKIVAQGDDSPFCAQDALIEVVAVEDGPHKVALREANLGGADNAAYMLHVGAFPRPRIVSPLGARPGEKVTFRYTDTTGLHQPQATMPASPVGTFALHLSDTFGTAPTPNPIRVTEHPVVEETESKQPASPVPVAFHGVVSQAGEIDSRFFTAKKGNMLLVEVWAQRLGTSLEPVLEVADQEGRVLVASDDDDGHDPRARFLVPADGTYCARIRDQRGQGSAFHAYRVEVGPLVSPLHCFLPRPNKLSQERQSVLVPSGNRTLVIFGVRRGDLTGETVVTGANLPSGLKATFEPARPGEFRIPCLFEAPVGANPAGSLAQFSVAHGGNNRGGFKQFVDLVSESADTLYRGIETDRLAVAVGLPAPVSIELDTPRAALPVDGTIVIKARIKRSPPFDGAVEVLVPFLPAWVEGPDVVKIAAGKSEAEIVLTALPEAVPATWPLVVEAKPLDGSSGRVASSFVPLKIVPPLMTSPALNLVAEQGGSARFQMPLSPQGSAHAGTAALLEMPPRVSTPAAAVPAGGRIAALDATVAKDGPVGHHRNIVCGVSMVINGEKVTQFVARGSTLKIEPPGTRAVGPDGKPLSRLDQLRAKAAEKTKP